MQTGLTGGAFEEGIVSAGGASRSSEFQGQELTDTD